MKLPINTQQNDIDNIFANTNPSENSLYDKGETSEHAEYPLTHGDEDKNNKRLCANINIAGTSAQIEAITKAIAEYAEYDAPVLISGETGTGKELVARGIHYSGKRSNKPFIAVNCATLSMDLFNSELYGHVKGSFTDAKQDKKGLIYSAEGGTLFLDEIDSLNLDSQASLLRFLQESEYRPIGSNKTFTANVRLIASVNSNLHARMERGEFRRDLYYRLYVFGIHVPPLRERKCDIPVLANYFLDKFNCQYDLGRKSMSDEFVSQIMVYEWPGNVRELENLIHRMYLSGESVLVGCNTESSVEVLNYSDELNGVIESDAGADTCMDEGMLRDVCCEDGCAAEDNAGCYNFTRDKKVAIEIFESRYIKSLLQMTNGNVTKAAEMCGKDRSAFGKMVKKYKVKIL